MRAQFIPIHGVRMRYLIAGSGPTLLLIHGMGHSADLFVRNIDELAQHFTVIAPDLPGHGFADMVELGTRSPQRAAAHQITGLVDHLGLDDYHVLGSSYGGLVAALCVFERPASARSLILVGSGSALHPSETQHVVLDAVYENGSKAMLNPTLDVCRSRLAAICHSPDCIAEEILLVQITSYALPDRLAAFQATIRALQASLRSPEDMINTRLDHLTLPTLILTGREDIRAKWAIMAAAASALPQGKLATFERCGHLPYLEYPEAFNHTVTDFIKQVLAT